MNRRVRNRTHGGVGGRRGQPCLLPDQLTVPSRAAGSVEATTPITTKDADRVIAEFLNTSKLAGKISLNLSDSFDTLPDEVRKAAEDAGGTQKNTYTVLHKDGSIGGVMKSFLC